MEIAGLSPEIADRLRRVRRVILREVPDPQQKMRHGVAAIMLGGRYDLVSRVAAAIVASRNPTTEEGRR